MTLSAIFVFFNAHDFCSAAQNPANGRLEEFVLASYSAEREYRELVLPAVVVRQSPEGPVDATNIPEAPVDCVDGATRGRGCLVPDKETGRPEDIRRTVFPD